MQAVLSSLKEHENTLLKLLPLVSFAVPLLWLYFLDAGSFELMWKGRTFQLFFIWLIALELILSWETIQPNKMGKPTSAKTFAFVAALLLPTLYVVTSNYLGLNSVIAEVSRQSGVTWWESMALSTEYLVFALFFCLMVFLQFGKEGLKNFSVPAFFLGIVGALYTIDNIFPYGQFTPFQLLVPTTATLAANLLNLMGYQTSLSTTSTMALRRHRELTHLHCSGTVILEKNAHKLENKNSLLCSRRRSHLPHQHPKNRRHIHNRNGRRRRTAIPLLLRSIILYRMDRIVSPDNPRKPKPMAQNLR
jgi:hypothetical protein